MTISWLPGDERRLVRIPSRGVELEGELCSPPGAQALVVCAHDAGGRRSPRNQFVAQALRNQGFATLQIDLLTPAEEAGDRFTGLMRADSGLLAARLVDVMAWLAADPASQGLGLGLFGGGSGLIAAAAAGDRFRAFVLRGGRTTTRLPAPALYLAGPTYPFEAPGALDDVARLAGTWFAQHLVARPVTLPTAGEPPDPR